MKISHTPLADMTGRIYPHLQNADTLRQWSQVATPCKRDAIKAQASIQRAIDHLHKPGSSLHYLDLSECGLTSLPPFSVWQQLQGITILNINQNNLPGTELEKLRGMDTLQFLNLSDNPLRDIPAGVLSGQSKLQTLEASGCELQHIPEDILECAWLDTLSLQDNPLHALPENMGFAMRNLGELNIQGTEIGQLPDSLAYLGRLIVNR